MSAYYVPGTVSNCFMYSISFKIHSYNRQIILLSTFYDRKKVKAKNNLLKVTVNDGNGI